MNYFLDLDSDFELAVSESSQVLKEGGLVLLPTDTVYGVAAIPTNKSAVEEIFQRKNRLDDQACAVLVSETSQASELVVSSAEFELLSQKFWPGPLTVVIERADHLDYFFSITFIFGSNGNSFNYGFGPANTFFICTFSPPLEILVSKRRIYDLGHRCTCNFIRRSPFIRFW